MVDHDIFDIELATKGALAIEWSGRQMPVLASIQARFEQEKPFAKLTIAACLHVTAETANLMLALKAGGAKVVLCASNPLSTQDAVAAALVKVGISVFAIRGEDNKTYYKHLNQVLDFHPDITMDDGADLVTLLHTTRASQQKEILGSSEETTTGVIRLRAMAADNALKIPVIAANDSKTKHLFDNHYGTGQSSIDGLLRAANILLAGKVVVVIGYGQCSSGIAKRAAGMGARVMVTEVDPVKALQAAMDGFVVTKLKHAVDVGDVFITATGNKHTIPLEMMRKMKDGAIMGNAGHFDIEIDIKGLEAAASKKREVRHSLTQYQLGEKSLFVIGEGRLMNLAAAEGHPASVMDMSFANQALAAEYFVYNKGKLRPRVYVLPDRIDEMVAKLKLKSMGMGLDKLTREQKRYLNSWQEGT